MNFLILISLLLRILWLLTPVVLGILGGLYVYRQCWTPEHCGFVIAVSVAVTLGLIMGIKGFFSG